MKLEASLVNQALINMNKKHLKLFPLIIILASVLHSTSSTADEEIWIHFNPEYHFDHFVFRPENHLRNNLTNGVNTKALKLNMIANQFVMGAAYFDVSSGTNERRGYLGRFHKVNNWQFRNIVELRDFNNNSTKWRLRSKIDYEWKKNIIPTAEILYQTGGSEITELRAGIAYRTNIRKSRFSVLPSIISSQKFKTRYILMIGEYF